jgi:hypothetical protein
MLSPQAHPQAQQRAFVARAEKEQAQREQARASAFAHLYILAKIEARAEAWSRATKQTPQLQQGPLRGMHFLARLRIPGRLGEFFSELSTRLGSSEEDMEDHLRNLQELRDEHARLKRKAVELNIEASFSFGRGSKRDVFDVNKRSLQAKKEEICELYAVVQLQRAWRQRNTVYRKFGHELFVRAGGLPASHGTIYFPGEANTLLGPQRFLVCSKTSSAELLAGCLAHGPWSLQLQRPELLIVVAGSAADFRLEPPRLARLFDKGIADAARDARAVITAAGTDMGVSKLVASAMANNNIKQPVIGIAPFGKILGGKELLGYVEDETVTYTNLPKQKDDEAGHKPAPLNPDHTHFLLVDSPGIQWGEESQLRAEVEMLYARFVACPIVCLCVQGGPGTVELLYESAKKRTPCVIVAQSGGVSFNGALEVFQASHGGRVPRARGGECQGPAREYRAGSSGVVIEDPFGQEYFVLLC